MKKFLTIIAALAITVMASAQNYEWTGPFGMPYVGVNAGAFAPLDAPTFGDFVKGFNPSASVEFGTYFTPIWGASIEGIGLFGIKDRAAVAETEGSRYLAFDRAAALVNGKVNISNLLAGYKGEPRRVELVGVAGIGYGHNFNEEAAILHSTFYKAGTELNINLGQKKAWQVSVRPTVLWNNQNAVYPKLSVRDANFQLTAGIVYKFGNRRVKSHNFVTNTYDAYQKDYDDLLGKYNELDARKPKVVEKEVVKVEEKVVKEVVEVEIPVGSTVYFDLGKFVLSERELARLDYFAKGFERPQSAVIKVTGSADSSTGSVSRNKYLAEKRAEVVKNLLVEKYGFNASNIITEVILDVFEKPASSRVAIIE